MKFNFRQLILQIAIPLIVGALASFLTRNSMSVYTDINRPSFSPPSALFPIVWTILYILMGIAAYLIVMSDSPDKTYILSIYGIQLLLNFVWPILFFTFQNYSGAFVILMILWVLIVLMIYNFYKVNKFSAVLLIPYLLWVTFAGLLNLTIVLLN